MRSPPAFAMRSLAALAAAFLLACEPTGRLGVEDDAEEALASLRAPTASARFDTRYWEVEVQERDSALWRRAVLVCQAMPPGDPTPGCQTLYVLHLSDLHARREAQETAQQAAQAAAQAAAQDGVAPTSRDTPLDTSREASLGPPRAPSLGRSLFKPSL